MERVKNIFATFFDINTLSIQRIITSLVILLIFIILKNILSKLIIKIVKRKKVNSYLNSFYRPLKIFFPALGLYLAIQILHPIGNFANFISKLSRIFIVFLCTYSIGTLVAPNSLFEKKLKAKLNKANDGMIKMICKALKLTIYILGVIIAISELGYNISGIIAGIGIGGVAIALAAQDTASNIIGALMIILDKPFEVGDWIRIDETEGSVEEFTFRSVRIREASNSLVSIPNTTVVNSVITNWSRLQKRRISLDLVLEFSTPLKKVADVQNDILIYLENEPKIINDGLYVKFNEIKNNGYNLKVYCFTPILDYIEYLGFLDKVNFNIMSIINKQKVNLAYNSETVYLKNSK